MKNKRIKKKLEKVEKPVESCKTVLQCSSCKQHWVAKRKKESEMMFLVKNGAAVATIETALKEVRASSQSTTDAINARYQKVLVNAQTYKVSKNKKYAKLELPTACHKAGFRENEFLIIE